MSGETLYPCVCGIADKMCNCVAPVIEKMRAAKEAHRVAARESAKRKREEKQQSVDINKPALNKRAQAVGAEIIWAEKRGYPHKVWGPDDEGFHCKTADDVAATIADLEGRKVPKHDPEAEAAARKTEKPPRDPRRIYEDDDIETIRAKIFSPTHDPVTEAEARKAENAAKFADDDPLEGEKDGGPLCRAVTQNATDKAVIVKRNLDGISAEARSLLLMDIGKLLIKWTKLQRHIEALKVE